MYTKEKDSLAKKVVLIILIILGNLALNSLSIIGIMKYLPGESYAVRTIYIIIISIVIFAAFIFEAILTVDSSRINGAIHFCIVLLIPIIILIVFEVFHENVSDLTAYFAHISCKCFRFVHQNEDAHASIEEAISLNPEKYSYWNESGDLYFEEENYKKCIYYYDKAFELGETSEEILFKQGRAYRKTGELDKALTNLTTVIEAAPQNAEYNYELASIYHSYGKSDSEYYDTAIQYYTTAIDLDPDNKEYYYQRARAYRGLKDSSAELNDIQKAIEYDESNPVYHNFLGTFYYNSNNFEDAITEYLLSIQEASDNSVYYFNLGDAYYMDNQYENAIDSYSTAINADPDNILYLSRRGICYSLIGDTESSKNDLVSIMMLQESGDDIIVD